MKEILLPEDYVPSEDEEYMNPQHLAFFRKQLQSWRKELLEESEEAIDQLRDQRQEGDAADRASLELDAAIEIRTRERYRKLIDKIDAALGRIEDGSYGYCEETGEAIGLKRLQARPIATLTIEAQERHERYERHHRED